MLEQHFYPTAEAEPTTIAITIETQRDYLEPHGVCAQLAQD